MILHYNDRFKDLNPLLKISFKILEIGHPRIKMVVYVHKWKSVESKVVLDPIDFLCIGKNS